jgi:hypothetical protein
VSSLDVMVFLKSTCFGAAMLSSSGRSCVACIPWACSGTQRCKVVAAASLSHRSPLPVQYHVHTAIHSYSTSCV